MQAKTKKKYPRYARYCIDYRGLDGQLDNAYIEFDTYRIGEQWCHDTENTHLLTSLRKIKPADVGRQQTQFFIRDESAILYPVIRFFRDREYAETWCRMVGKKRLIEKITPIEAIL